MDRIDETIKSLMTKQRIPTPTDTGHMKNGLLPASLMMETSDRPEAYICRECGECHEYSVYSLGSRWLAKRIECSCEKETRIEAERAHRLEITQLLIYKQSGIPYIHRGIRLDDVEAVKGTAKARRAIKEYVAAWPDSGNLILSGEVGNGKTMLACCIANVLMPKLIWVEMWNMPRYMAGLASTFGVEQDEGTWRRPLPDKPDLLILDDLGDERYKHEWCQSEMYVIIDSRYTQNMPIVVTTNQATEDGLSRIVGDRATDRLLHKATWVTITAPSYRRAEYEARKGRK